MCIPFPYPCRAHLMRARPKRTGARLLDMRRTGLVLDLLTVLVFVAIGRGVHAHGLSLGGMASTSWPFLVGLALGWLAVTVTGRSSASLVGGLAVLIATVTLGMVLRVVSGQGTAFAFVLVALGFLGATMLGWRLVVTGLRRHTVRSAPPVEVENHTGLRDHTA